MRRSRRERRYLRSRPPYPLQDWARDQLAAYNAECGRGLVHTPEWERQMAVLQRKHDEWASAPPAEVAEALAEMDEALKLLRDDPGD